MIVKPSFLYQDPAKFVEFTDLEVKGCLGCLHDIESKNNWVCSLEISGYPFFKQGGCPWWKQKISKY